jgi:hypothetical protein
MGGAVQSIYVHFSDPARSTSSNFDAIYEWRSSVALGAALDATLAAARPA